MPPTPPHTHIHMLRPVGFQNGEKALLTAIRGGHEEIVQLLLDKGASMEAANKVGSKGPHVVVVWQGVEG